jgi:hypothetical protein
MSHLPLSVKGPFCILMHIDYYRYTSSAGALAPAHLAYLFQYEAHFNLANKARFHLEAEILHKSAPAEFLWHRWARSKKSSRLCRIPPPTARKRLISRWRASRSFCKSCSCSLIDNTASQHSSLLMVALLLVASTFINVWMV